MPRAHQYPYDSGAARRLEGAGVHIEPQRQSWTGGEFLCHPVVFDRRIRTVRRPPERSGLTQYIAEDVRVSKARVCGGEPAEAVAPDDCAGWIHCDVVSCANPRHELR